MNEVISYIKNPRAIIGSIASGDRNGKDYAILLLICVFGFIEGITSIVFNRDIRELGISFFLVLVQVFIGYYVASALLYCVSALFKARSSYSNMRSVCAYSLILTIPAYLISIIAVIMSNTGSSDAAIAIQFTGIPFILLSFAYTVIGVSAAGNISNYKAFFVCATSLLVSLLIIPVVTYFTMKYSLAVPG